MRPSQLLGTGIADLGSCRSFTSLVGFRERPTATGRIDIFLNNAGIEGGIHPIPDYPTELFRRVIEINVVAVYFA